MNPLHLVCTLWFETVQNTDNQDLHGNMTSDEANQSTKISQTLMRVPITSTSYMLRHQWQRRLLTSKQCNESTFLDVKVQRRQLSV